MPLVDTSVLLAALAPRDRRHRECRSALMDATKPLLTTTAVMTELFYLILSREPWLLDIGWRMFSTGVVRLSDIASTDLPAIEALMRRYADRPMDFADATLVYVAGRENIADILTVDHDDFETYRFGRNRKFRISPERKD